MTKPTISAGATPPPSQTEQPPASEPVGGGSHKDLEPAGLAILALSMGQPGTRLDMVLGGPHPLLVDIVRRLARKAARDYHVGTATATSETAKRVGTPKQDK